MSKLVHKDIYLGDTDLWDRIEKLVKKLKHRGVADASPSAVVRMCCELAIPLIESAKSKVKEIEFKNDLTNIKITKVADTYRVIIENFQDKEKAQVGVSFHAKGDDNRTVKKYKRVMFERKGLEIKAKVKTEKKR